MSARSEVFALRRTNLEDTLRDMPARGSLRLAFPTPVTLLADEVLLIDFRDALGLFAEAIHVELTLRERNPDAFVDVDVDAIPFTDSLPPLDTRSEDRRWLDRRASLDVVELISRCRPSDPLTDDTRFPEPESRDV